ncbi:hypothetical protein JR316_0011595 [Psilocybe cubensis]|uniref:Uncharacterized protein n=2 Tax=Psilocybe cubensis TaxID=181762 RepID=A0A8H7XX70_PSICU|nr:hypothetical protein JR316_0011595 [Psilocybe cubensis]KAH9476026.1 hypothetical protein JR316_0011595 [Psilocybe cubensis]
MDLSKVTRSSKGFQRLFNIARPFKKCGPSSEGGFEGLDAPNLVCPDPHASEKRVPERKLRSRGTLLEFFQKAILCINATREAMEEDIISDYADVMGISPSIVERAQSSGSRFIEGATVFGLQVDSISVGRATFNGPIERSATFNPTLAPIDYFDVALMKNTKSTAARNIADFENSSERVMVKDTDPFGECRSSFYAEKFMNIGPTTHNINDLNFYFADSNKSILADAAAVGHNRSAVRRLLPLNKIDRRSSKETFCGTKSLVVPPHKKVVLPHLSERPKSTVTQTRMPMKGWSISKHVVKHSTTPRYTMDANGMPVRRPKGKARIQRLYYIHNSVLPMIEEEDAVYHIMELELPESSPSVADSISVYSQDSYISQDESVSSPELANIVAVDSKVHDIGGQYEEGGEHEDKTSFILEDEDGNDDDDDDDSDNAMFSEISTAILRSRERRQNVCGREQLYVCTYAAPLLAIAKERQQANHNDHNGHSLTGLRPLLLPISVSLQGDSGNAED